MLVAHGVFIGKQVSLNLTLNCSFFCEFYKKPAQLIEQSRLISTNERMYAEPRKAENLNVLKPVYIKIRSACKHKSLVSVSL